MLRLLSLPNSCQIILFVLLWFVLWALLSTSERNDLKQEGLGSGNMAAAKNVKTSKDACSTWMPSISKASLEVLKVCCSKYYVTTLDLPSRWVYHWQTHRLLSLSSACGFSWKSNVNVMIRLNRRLNKDQFKNIYCPKLNNFIYENIQPLILWFS